MKPRTPPPQSFRRPETVREGARRIVSAFADDVATQAARAPAECEAAVHQTRVALKRIRALVRLVGPGLEGEAARLHDRRLRNVSRRLAPARDAVVGLATLDSLLKAAPGRRARAVARVRSRFARVVHDRNATAGSLVSALRAAATSARATATWLDRARWTRHGWAVLEAGLHAAYRRSRRRFKAASSNEDETAFHAWRTAVKGFMYQLSFLVSVSPRRLRACLKDLNTLQSALADEHDLFVLDAFLAGSAATLGGKAAVHQTRKLLSQRQRRHRKVALKLGGRLLTRRPGDYVQRLHKDWRRWRRR